MCSYANPYPFAMLITGITYSLGNKTIPLLYPFYLFRDTNLWQVRTMLCLFVKNQWKNMTTKIYCRSMPKLPYQQHVRGRQDIGPHLIFYYYVVFNAVVFCFFVIGKNNYIWMDVCRCTHKSEELAMYWLLW